MCSDYLIVILRVNFLDVPSFALTVTTIVALPFLSAVILTFLADFLTFISFFPDLIFTFIFLTDVLEAFALKVTLFLTLREVAFLPESITELTAALSLGDCGGLTVPPLLPEGGLLEGTAVTETVIVSVSSGLSSDVTVITASPMLTPVIVAMPSVTATVATASFDDL